MTSIRDISNNRNKLHDDYKNTKREIDKILNDFEQLQKKKLPLEVYSVLKYELRIHFLNADNRRIELQKKIQQAHYVSGSHIPTIKISTKKMKALHPEICGICMEHHAYRFTITTSCGHHFGKKCFSKWIDTCFENYKDISCALCRDTNFALTRYISKT
jgi:hypothetical protein